MTQTLRINNMPPNLNVYRNMHFRELDKQKKEWESIVGWIVKEQKIQPVERIRQTYEFWFKTKIEHDPDNFACCAKFINDGLVKAGILPRDNFNHIESLTIKQGGFSKNPYILVHLEPVA